MEGHKFWNDYTMFKLGEQSMNDVLHEFRSSQREILKTAFLDNTLGILYRPAKFGYACVDVCGAELGPFGKKYSNIFLVRVPYAGNTISWEVRLYDDLDTPPDFYFNEDFLENFEMFNQLPGIINWKTDVKKSLMNILRDLYPCFNKFHVQKLNNTKLPLAKKLYNSLSDEHKNRTEVIVRDEVVFFMVAVDHKLPCLPPYIPETIESEVVENPLKDSAAIQFKFRSNRSSTALFLSPRLKQVLCNNSNFKFPTYRVEMNENPSINEIPSINKYIKKVNKIVKKRAENVSSKYEQRIKFICTVLEQSIERKYTIVEYDSILFSTISFLNNDDSLYKMKNFKMITIINLTEDFPETQPKIVLLSIYPSDIDAAKWECNNFLYDPNVEPKMLLEKIIKHAEECSSLLDNESP